MATTEYEEALHFCENNTPEIIAQQMAGDVRKIKEAEARAERAEARADELDRMVRAVRDRAYDDGDDVGEGWYRRADELCPPEALAMPSGEQLTPEQAQGKGQERGEYGDVLAALAALVNQAHEYSDDHEKALIEEAHATVRRHLTASAVPEEVRRLPERWRKEALELLNGDTDQAHAEADTLQDCAGFLRDALASAPAVPDVARESEVLRRMTLAMREADSEFERVGGSTRHYVRDCLMPVMEEKGLAITSIADTEMNDE